MVNKLMKEENKTNENDEVINNEKEDFAPNYKDKELWRVGIICNKDCFSLTEEILKILLKKDMNGKLFQVLIELSVEKERVKKTKIMKNILILIL